MDHRQRPRLHGRDHLPGGADPIPGLLVKGGVGAEGTVLALGATSLWKLDEASGSTAHDSIGSYDLALGDGTIAFGGDPGPPGTSSMRADSGRAFNNSYPSLFDADFSMGGWANIDASFIFGCTLMGMGNPFHSGTPSGVALGISNSSYKPVLWVHDSGGSGDTVEGDDVVSLPGWHLFGMSYEGGVWTLYIDGVPQTTTSTQTITAGGSTDMWIARDGFGYTGGLTEGVGNYSYAFTIDRALSGGEWEQVYEGSNPEPADGYVFTLNETAGARYEFPHVLVLADAPLAPQAGWIYFDTGLGELRVYDGSAWQSVALS